MTISRRGFLTAMLAAGAAPYVMSSAIGRGVLMPVREIWTPPNDLQWTEYEIALARSIRKGGASIINILPRLYQ